MRLDRKLLLIAPTIILAFVVAGIVYASLQLHVLASVSDTLKDRGEFIAQVERGAKPLDESQALKIIHAQFEFEAKRSAALTAARDLLVVLGGIVFASVITLSIGIRKVPREHWPKFSFVRESDTSPPAEGSLER